jgi:hypothetical protein
VNGLPVSSVEVPIVPIVDLPVPTAGVTGEVHEGGQATRIEFDSTDLNNGLSVYYRLAYVGGGSRLRVFERYAPTSSGAESNMVDSERIAWQFANTVLERTSGASEPPQWARFHTGNDWGGSSGLIFTLAYLDLLTPGTLVGNLRVAGTGGIGGDGVVAPVTNIEIKVASAVLTDPDVVFTTRPSDWIEDVTVIESQHTRNPDPGYTIGEWLNLRGYEQAGRYAAGHDGTAFVVVHDVRQVLAWLCGRTGNDLTCTLARHSATIPIGVG